MIVVVVAKLILVVGVKLGIVVVARFAAELGPSYVIEELPVLGMSVILKHVYLKLRTARLLLTR